MTEAAFQPVAPAVTNNSEVLHLLDQARNAIASADLQKALTALKLAVSIEPNNVLLRVRFGSALNLAGDFPDAEEQLRYARSHGAPDDLALPPLFDAMLSQGKNQTVLDLFPDPGASNRTYVAAVILRARASALQTLGNAPDATRAINRSLAIYRDYDGVMTAARVALLQQNLPDAEKRVDEALQLKPDDTDTLIFKIDVLMQAGQQSQALALAEKLVSNKPRSVEALLARIKVYLSLGLTDKARPDVDRILAVKPNVSVARYFRAIILARAKDRAGAWSIAHSLPPEYLQTNPEIALNVADMAIDAGFLNSGAAILNSAVFKFPNFLKARLRLADILLREKAPQSALNALALVEDSKDPEVSILLARAYLMTHALIEAHSYIQRSIELGGGELLRDLGKDVALNSLHDYIVVHPNDGTANKQYAVLLLGFGELARAKAAYEELVRNDPTDAFSLNNLAWLVVKDDPSRALDLARQAVKQSPGSPHYLDTLGSMQLNLGDVRAALASLKQAHQILPNEGLVSYHLALALETNGEHTAALTTLQAAVAQGGFGDLNTAKALLIRWQSAAHGRPDAKARH